ncbi:MAG: Rrf2 family transcriptional regulator [Bacteroidales bacterium]|nr:Rrf2 family transcriptional regulator [Bacteroidales bacterium]
MISKKTQYAMLALTKLAKEYGNGPIPISEIAISERIPQRFLENILLEIKKMGILGSRLGKAGGYYLIKKPEEVSLGEIVRQFEGTIAMIYCISEKAYQPCEFCKNEKACKIRKVFKEVRDSTLSILQRTTLDQLID